MGFEIVRNPPTPTPGFKTDRRLCVTADRSRVVEEQDPEAAFLLIKAGGMISAADVDRYGLTKADDGTVQLADRRPSRAATPPTPAPADPPKAKSGKAAKPAADA